MGSEDLDYFTGKPNFSNANIHIVNETFESFIGIYQTY